MAFFFGCAEFSLLSGLSHGADHVRKGCEDLDGPGPRAHGVLLHLHEDLVHVGQDHGSNLEK